MQSSSDRGLGLPDTVLTELSRAQIPPENFAAVLSAFGRLPEEAQYELTVRLADEVAIYGLRRTVEKQKLPLPHRRRKQLKDISTSARRILKLLGIDKAELIAGGVRIGSNLHPTAITDVLTGLYTIGVQRRPEMSNISATERLATALVLLSDLVEAAEQSLREINTRPGRGGDRRAPVLTAEGEPIQANEAAEQSARDISKRGRGGDRRTGKLTAEGALIQSIIKLYLEFRERFPSSGPHSGFDEALRKFVRSGLELAVSYSHSVGSDGKNYEPWYMSAVDRNLPKPTRITDAAIRGAFQRLHKPKENRD
jgi:hypothetical protein